MPITNGLDFGRNISIHIETPALVPVVCVYIRFFTENAYLSWKKNMHSPPPWRFLSLQLYSNLLCEDRCLWLTSQAMFLWLQWPLLCFWLQFVVAQRALLTYVESSFPFCRNTECDRHSPLVHGYMDSTYRYYINYDLRIMDRKLKEC